MSRLQDLLSKPKVVINNEVYVPQELYKRYLVEKLDDEKLDCNSDERDGIEIAIQVIENS